MASDLRAISSGQAPSRAAKQQTGMENRLIPLTHPAPALLHCLWGQAAHQGYPELLEQTLQQCTDVIHLEDKKIKITN